MKNVCVSKDAIKKVKRKPTEWDKMFSNHISDKGLVSKVYRELLQLNKKKITQLKNRQRT